MAKRPVGVFDTPVGVLDIPVGVLDTNITRIRRSSSQQSDSYASVNSFNLFV